MVRRSGMRQEPGWTGAILSGYAVARPRTGGWGGGRRARPLAPGPGLPHPLTAQADLCSALGEDGVGGEEEGRQGKGGQQGFHFHFEDHSIYNLMIIAPKILNPR